MWRLKYFKGHSRKEFIMLWMAKWNSRELLHCPIHRARMGIGKFGCYLTPAIQVFQSLQGCFTSRTPPWIFRDPLTQIRGYQRSDWRYRLLAVTPKGRCNYSVDLWYNQKSSTPKFYIHFFIDNLNANISLYALSCPNFNLGQHKVCKLMFTLRLSMKKWI